MVLELPRVVTVRVQEVARVPVLADLGALEAPVRVLEAVDPNRVVEAVREPPRLTRTLLQSSEFSERFDLMAKTDRSWWLCCPSPARLSLRTVLMRFASC